MSNGAFDRDDTDRRDAMMVLTREMDEAAAAFDYERAQRLRDRLTLLRGGATLEEAMAADTAGLVRQQPGKMGLGTSRQRMTPPEGWRPPPKPDPMTRATGKGSARKDRR